MRLPGSRTIKNVLDQANKRGVILMYHRVVDQKNGLDPWGLCVSPKHFEEQLQVLRKISRPIALKKMVRSLHKFPLGAKETVLTFDDGYADNFHNAQPLLEKYEVPATFFIVSGAVNSKEEFWWDELERIILEADQLPECFDLEIAGIQYNWKIISERGNKTFNYDAEVASTLRDDRVSSPHKLYMALWRILAEFTYSGKKDILCRIGQWAKESSTPRASYYPMTSDELASLAKGRLVDIGAHTVSHPLLSRLSVSDQEREIVRSKRDLEDMLNQPVSSFSYPHGDRSNETVRLVKEAGFHNACAVLPQPIRRGSDPFQLPRFTVNDWDGNEFEKNLSKWLHLSFEN